MSRVFYVTGTNSETPLTNNPLPEFADYKKLTPESIIRPDDSLVVVDLNRSTVKTITRFKLKPSQCTLIRQEPAIVCPSNYDARKLKLFSKIVDVGRVTSSSTLAVPWPQQWPQGVSRYLDFDNRNSFAPVMMNANKMSFVAGELYSLRRRLAHQQLIHLFGPKWDSSPVSRFRTLIGEFLVFFNSGQKLSRQALSKWFSKHPEYKGLANNKLDVYSNYKVVVAIENSADYTSEKLLDALFAGCIPVYVGPPVSSIGIPEGIVVESKATLDSLRNSISKALDIDYELWKKLTRSYLESEETVRYWSPEQIFRKISRHIHGDLDFE